MKIIDPNKALAIALGTAGLYWATNKKLPDWLVITALLASVVTLARDVSELVIETEPEILPEYIPTNNSLPFDPFDIQF